MTYYEKITVIVQIATLLILLLGILFSLKQLRKVTEQLNQNSKIHSQNHQWNRRIASQQALVDNTNSKQVFELVNELNILNRKEPIPLKQILDLFTEKPHLQNSSHWLLNQNEAFARGVHFGIYEEAIIRNARKGVMKKILHTYRNYIDFRRQDTNINVWTEFESLVTKWAHEDSAKLYEKKTGEV